MKRKFSTIIVLLLTCALLLALGVVPAFAEEPVLSDETLTIATEGEPTGLVLPLLTGTLNTYEASFIYDQLMFYNSETGEIEPRLATSWELIDDTTLRLHLRDDVICHDGSQFTAEDVMYTMKVGFEGGLSMYATVVDLEKCKVVDDYTFDLGIQAPMPDLLMQLCLSAYTMLDQSGVEAAGGPDAALVNPIGATGKYKFVSWVPGESITLERNEEYWGEKGYYKTIKFSFISDATTRLMALQSGEVDVNTSVAMSQVPMIEGQPGYTTWSQSALGAYTLYMNCTGTPFENLAVRQAVAYAIDRNALFFVAGGGHGEMTDINVSTVCPGYTAGQQEYYPHDIDKAKELMAEAGYAEGFSVKLIQTADDTASTVSEMVQSALGEIGIKVEIVASDILGYLGMARTGDYDMIVTTTSNYNLKTVMNYVDGRCDYGLAMGGCAWNNDEVNALIDQADAAKDEAERYQYMGQAFEIVRQNVPLIGLFNVNKFCVTKEGIKGLSLCPNGDWFIGNITK